MLRFFSSILIVLIIFGCSKKDGPIYTPSERVDPFQIYSEGIEAMRENDYFFANKTNYAQFWNTVKNLKPSDTANFSQEDASNLQTVVQQVAQMDDDINNPKRENKVKGEYSKIQSELKEAGVERR